MPDRPDAWQTHDLPFDAQRPGAVARFERREWLLTAGDGSYAMGTALGRNTRRYHGLIVAAAHPPVDRVVALNQVFETLVLSHDAADHAQRLEFSTCGFQDEHGHTAYAPRGFRYLQRVQRGLTMTWHYAWGDLRWSRTLVLHPAKPNTAPAATLRYDIEPFDPSLGTAKLELAPMLTLRGFHDLHDGRAIETRESRTGVIVCQTDEHAVALACTGAAFASEPDTWHGVHYPVDAYRGQGDAEDHVLPGRFVADVQPGTPVHLSAALGEKAAKPTDDPAARRQRLVAMRNALEPIPSPTAEALAIAADDFVVARTVAGKRLSTIIAGYPWFADWGRDTFIALPGLLLSAGRDDEAAGVLRVFAGALRSGLVPNRFDDTDPDAAHYNTVDGSMWFVHAALAYAETLRNKGKTTPGWLVDAVAAVLDAHLDGTAAQDHKGRDVPIRCDIDGLIAAGDDRTQLTWMDAACPTPQEGASDGDWAYTVFTPRPGKCVEVNALWCSNLAGVAALLDDRRGQKRRAARYRDAADRANAAFLSLFWNADAKILLDHVRPDGTPNRQLRPNGCFACSLERSPLSADQRAAVLDRVQRELLTPVGLRTLATDDPHYAGTYGGPQWQRDSAYHQGTVWPWLLGAYAEGRLRAGNFSDPAKRQARDAIAPLLASLTDAEDPAATLGQLHEIHDGDTHMIPDEAAHGPTSPRHRPRGCIAQAWSVAEVLRIAKLVAEP